MNKININKKKLAVLIGGAVSFTLIGCRNINNEKEAKKVKDESIVEEISTNPLIIEKNVYDIRGHKLIFKELENITSSNKLYKVSYINKYHYITREGETLKSISEKCNVNISQLLSENKSLEIDYTKVNFEDEALPYNTNLIIKYVKTYKDAITLEEKNRLEQESNYYEVKPNECLLQIAQDNHISKNLIMIMNDMENEYLYEYQNILIPSKEKVYKKTN